MLRVLTQSEKLLAVAFHPCLLCSGLNAFTLSVHA